MKVLIGQEKAVLLGKWNRYAFNLKMIEKNDNNQMQTFQGFIRGESALSLLDIIRTGGLMCSQSVRTIAGNRQTLHDDNVGGVGSYFRFVTGNTESKPVNFASVGASGAVFFYMPKENTEGLYLATMSAQDNKGKNMFGDYSIESMNLIGTTVSKIGQNASKIAFLGGVSLHRFTSIRMDVNKFSHVDDRKYNETYDYVMSKYPFQVGDRKKSTLSRPIEGKDYLNLIGILLQNEHGFELSKSGDIYVFTKDRAKCNLVEAQHYESRFIAALNGKEYGKIQSVGSKLPPLGGKKGKFDKNKPYRVQINFQQLQNKFDGSQYNSTAQVRRTTMNRPTSKKNTTITKTHVDRSKLL